MDKIESQNQLLVQEYMQLQKTVEDFDARALTIKAWSVTFSAAGLALAYDKHNPQILLVASLSALVFWLTEAVWKIHQRAFYARIETIEDHFKSGGTGVTPPLQIRRSWFASYRGPQSGMWWLRIPFHLGVALPHLVIVAAGLLLCAFDPPRQEPPTAAASILIPPPSATPR